LDATVDLDLSPEQRALTDASVGLIEDACALPRVRELAQAGGRLDPEYLRRAGELGWFGLLRGGSSGVLDAAAVAEQRGGWLQPGPFVPTSTVVFALAEGGSEEQRATVLPALARGTELATWAVCDAVGTVAPTGLEARPTPTGFVLNGARGIVPDAHQVDWLLVAAGDEHAGGISHFLVPAAAPGLRITPLDGLDLTRTLCDVVFDGVELGPASLVGEGGDGQDQHRRQLHVATALALAETVGAMDRLFEWTLQYAKDRTAFGRPIGSFQAMKHLLADNSRLLETSKAVAVAAARAVDADPSGAAEVVSMAKAFVAEASIELAHACWQTFGGIAYTWDHDFHLYLRRLTADAAQYGDAAWHNERICAIHGL
jgi:alkylation response protein AidB-like acyl-CoA dehydrogenase